MRRPMRGIFCVLFTAAVLSAQTPAPKLSFDVATIKPAPNDIMEMAKSMQAGKSPFRIDEHRFEITFMRLRDLIAYAYEVPQFRVSGQDAILDGQHWEINATLPEGSTREQIPQMVQTLLADRFGLKIHRDSKEHSIYALVIARGGLKMKEAAPDSPAPATDQAPAGGDAKSGTTLNLGTGPMNIKQDGKGGATIAGSPMGDIKVSPSPDGMIHMEMSKVPMPAFIQQLSQYLDRPVVDMTELKGSYQIALDFPITALLNMARAQGINVPGVPANLGGGGGGTGPADAAADPAAMNSIFKSVENMGLKLEPRKQPLDDIVVDHVEKNPTDN